MIRRIISTLAKILPFFAVLLVFVEVIVINQLAGFGQTVSAMDKRIETIQEENALLAQQVASASSLIIIEQKAKENGFTEPKQSSYISLDEHLPIALVGNQ